MHDYKSNRELKKEFDKIVKGHDEAKKALINLFNRSKIRYYQKWKHLDDQYHLLEPSKILLFGPSGNGKTHLVETAARLMKAPLIKIDSTMLAPGAKSDGISAETLKEMINLNAKHLVNSSPNYHSVQGVVDQTIVFIDEIDKLACAFESSGNWNKHIQNSFLSVFDHKEEFAGVSFIFAGAFAGIENQVKVSGSIGFHKQDQSSYAEVEWDKEIIKYGLIPEFVGRIKSIHKIDTLTKDDYRSILENMLVPRKQDELIYYNHTGFYLKDHEAERMVTTAYTSGQGIRSLKRELDKHVMDLEFYYEDVATEQLLLENMIDRYGCQEE